MVVDIFEAWVCSQSNSGIAGSNPAEGHLYPSLVSVVLSGRRLYVGLISRPGEYY